ncbi:MAG TPA: hypothetical protein VM490_14860 [Armatimonadaceae bacterium]|nr:hypothetical protein [Armatimonadaceae bacterium]
MSRTPGIEAAQFRASSGSEQGFGATPREALEALMSRLAADAPPTPIVIWPFNRGDAFFTSTQQDRLRDLKARRASLTPAEYEELERLVEAAFDASISRTQSLQHVKS